MAGRIPPRDGDILGSLAGFPKEVLDLLQSQMGSRLGSAVLPLQVEMYFKQHPEAQQKLVDKVKGKVFNEVARNAVTSLNLDDTSIRTLASSDDFMSAAQGAAERMPMINDLIKDLKREGLTPKRWKEKMEGTPVGSLLYILMMILSLGSYDVFSSNHK